jgi:hypothetical protein
MEALVSCTTPALYREPAAREREGEQREEEEEKEDDLFKAIESSECDAGCAGPHERGLRVVGGRRGEKIGSQR